MARARRGRFNNKLPDEKSAIGFNLRQDALHRLDELRNATITAMVTFDTTPAEAVGFLFSPNTCRILTEAYGKVAGYTSTCIVKLAPHVGVRVTGFDDMGYATPTTECSEIDYAKAGPFLASVNKVSEIIDDFASVRSALIFMDRKFTRSAIRYYWPTLLSLLPAEQYSFPYELTERYVEPDGVGALIPLLRETASTVASALLLPAADDKPLVGLQLQYAGNTTFERHGRAITRETAYINI